MSQVCPAGLRAGAETTREEARVAVDTSGDGAPHPDGKHADIDLGVAGRSAQREFERRKALRAVRIKRRFGRFLGAGILAIVPQPQTTEAWALGAAGERRLAETFAEVADVIVLNDRRVPETRGNIDHLVIGPAGVFVVDTKEHRGALRIVDRGSPWRHDERLYVGGHDCSHLADNLGWQISPVRRFLQSSDLAQVPPVTAVLCFVEADWPLFAPPEEFAGVRLESRRSIKRLVTRTEVLHALERDAIAHTLGRAFPPK